MTVAITNVTITDGSDSHQHHPTNSMNNVVTSSNSSSVNNNNICSSSTTITVNNNTVSVNIEQISECPEEMSESVSSQTSFSLLEDQRPAKSVTESRQITDV